jgi:hypothetical protein
MDASAPFTVAIPAAPAKLMDAAYLLPIQPSSEIAKSAVYQ